MNDDQQYFATPKLFDNIGVLQAKLPFELFEGISNEIEKISKEGGGETYNHNLVGHIQEEYSLNHVKIFSSYGKYMARV